MILNQSFFRSPFRDAGAQYRVKHLRKERQYVKPQTQVAAVSFFSSGWASAGLVSAGLASAAAASFFSAFATGAAAGLGLPGLGSLNCLCSIPAFFNKLET